MNDKTAEDEVNDLAEKYELSSACAKSIEEAIQSKNDRIAEEEAEASLWRKKVISLKARVAGLEKDRKAWHNRASYTMKSLHELQKENESLKAKVAELENAGDITDKIRLVKIFKLETRLKICLDALRNLGKHYEFIGGRMYGKSTAFKIISKAITECEGKGGD